MMQALCDYAFDYALFVLKVGGALIILGACAHLVCALVDRWRVPPKPGEWWPW